MSPLAGMLVDDKRSITEVAKIAGIYGNLAEGRLAAIARLETWLERDEPNATEVAQVALARQQANIGAALVLMGHGEKVWPLLKHSPDPTVRSYLIERLGPPGVEVMVLAARLGEEQDVSARRALILCLGQYDRGLIRLAGREELVERLLGLYREDPDAGIHGAAEWVLRMWKEDEKLKEVETELATGRPEGKRQWFLNRQGQTLIVLPAPGEVTVGEEPFPDVHKDRVDWSYAIAAKEVTVEQFLRFQRNHIYGHVSPTEDCPVNNVRWYRAAEYCNWLSKEEGIPEGEWCYLQNKEGKYAAGMKLAPDWHRRRGYRLPTDGEWEHACRAGSVTPWSCGRADDLLERYAWFNGNSGGRSRPVGSLKPNEWGLFDMLGNGMEWVQGCYEWKDGKKYKNDIENNDIRTLRGGSFEFRSVGVTCATRGGESPTGMNDYAGVRPARTFR
jgi:formylglycine-generating enzyme required for sulfatase activity